MGRDSWKRQISITISKEALKLVDGLRQSKKAAGEKRPGRSEMIEWALWQTITPKGKS
jgi:epoxyqueuosine reductase QueG